jgi:hypothetical protein
MYEINVWEINKQTSSYVLVYSQYTYSSVTRPEILDENIKQNKIK